jgi:gamma-aminobutyric acid type B receptor
MKFYAIVALLFVADVGIIVAWIIFDPLQRQEMRFHLQDPPAGTEEDVMLLPILELCQSNNQEIWIALVLGYKCLLLVFGLFFAYESGNIKLRYINDSRSISISIYNVALLSLVTGPIVTFIIRLLPNAFFAFVSVTVLLCTYISLGLVFIPKVLYIYRTPLSKEEATFGSTNARATMSRTDQLRYEQLHKEHNELKRQIEIREHKISECRKVLEKRLGPIESRPMIASSPPTSRPTNASSNNNVSNSFVSDDQTTQSTTVFTTAALMEKTDTVATDFDSSGSSEILL